MPFIDALRQTLTNEQAEFGLEPFMQLLSEHHEVVIEMVAISVNQPRSFVEALTGKNAEILLMTWWTVNSDFFTRQAVAPQLEKIAKAQMQARNGAKSLNV